MIDARGHRDALGQRHKRNRACPEVAGVYRAQREERPVGVQGEFGFGRQVATVKVGQEGVAPLANPLDRPANAFCRPSDQRELRAAIVADPEIPADIAETTRTLSFATPSAPAMSSRCLITPPPALV